MNVRFDISKETAVNTLIKDYEDIAVRTAAQVLSDEGCSDDAYISLVLTDNDGIRQINRMHRDIDSATDVLSFPAVDFETPADFESIDDDSYFDPDTDELVLGDIVISLEKVTEQAKAYGHSQVREFAFLIAHSVLHLIGYDHEASVEDDLDMQARQEKALAELGITRDAQLDSEIPAGVTDAKRIVIKIGSSSLAHKDTGRLDLVKLEKLVRELSDIRNSGKEVVLVTSGAIMVGRNTLRITDESSEMNLKQAYSSVGQARLMMMYQKLFSEYNQVCSQILLTKNNMTNEHNRENACRTFEELLKLGVIPVVNENDTVATFEIDNLSVFGDNDTLSAVVAAFINADLLILLSDIDGLYTDDPHSSPDAQFIEEVDCIDESLLSMGKGSTGSSAGTGGMATKLSAASIAVNAGVDMIIASGEDFNIIHEILSGTKHGTLFKKQNRDMESVIEYINSLH